MADRSGSGPIEGEYKVLEERVEAYRPPPGMLQTDPAQPLVTYGLLALNVAMWLLMTLVGYLLRLNVNQQLLLFGAKVNQLIAQGQYWRLFTPMFLHIGLMHLLFNSYALYLYGPVVEKLFGKGKFILVYLISGLMGTMFSYVLSPNPAAGASGAIFGLMGALLYFRQRQKALFQRIFGPGLLMIIGINLFYGFVVPGIDNWGHIGGLVGGFLVGLGVGLYKDHSIGAKRILVLGLIAILFGAGIWYGGRIHGSTLLLERAIQSLRAGNFPEAEAYAREAAARRNPGPHIQQVLEAVYLTKADVLTRASDYPGALAAVDNLIGHYPKEPRYRMYRANLYEELKEYALALSDYIFVLETEQPTGQLLFRAGRAAYHAGRPAEARQYLTEALRISPHLRGARELLDLLDSSLSRQVKYSMIASGNRS